jgi:hypothetical protein
MFKKFLLFDFLITPWLVRIVYWLLQILIIILSYRIISGGNAKVFGTNFDGTIGGFLFLIICSIILRLITELMIISFKIAENTQYLKKQEYEKKLEL